MARTPNVSVAVPMTSVMMFAPGLCTAGALQNTAELHASIFSEAPMWQVCEPHEHSAEKTSKHLRCDVARDPVLHGKAADGGERDRDRRVEVSSADAADG